MRWNSAELSNRVNESYAGFSSAWRAILAQLAERFQQFAAVVGRFHFAPYSRNAFVSATRHIISPVRICIHRYPASDWQTGQMYPVLPL